jgi:hypothetical protein
VRLNTPRAPVAAFPTRPDDPWQVDPLDEFLARPSPLRAAG